MTAPPLENMVLLFVGVFIIYKIHANVMINVCNVQCYMLFVFETWFLILWKEYRLRAYNSSVIRTLNYNKDNVTEWWLELLNS